MSPALFAAITGCAVLLLMLLARRINAHDRRTHMDYLARKRLPERGTGRLR